MNGSNRIPWIVAAISMLFAMIVLVRNEVVPEAPQRPDKPLSQVVQPVMQAPESEWRSTGRPPRPAPEVGDYSPWGAQRPQPSPTPVVTPRPTPAPTPTPTPKPLFEFKGIVLDGDKPVSEALVRTISGEDNAAERSAVTAADGRFAIPGIPDDMLEKIIVEAPGYSVTLLENIPLPLPVELQIGMNPLAGIDAVVLDFSTTTAEPVLFSGEMQASLMELKKANEISSNSLGISEPVLPVDTYLPVRDQHVVVHQGELRFDNVPPGNYRVGVKTGTKIAESDPLTVAEGARTSTSLTLGMKHTVKGNVVAGDTGQPVAQARVGLAPYDQMAGGPDFPDYLGFTDGTGEFVIPEVQPGRFWLTVGAAGYTTKSLEGFTVLPGAPPEDTSITLTKQEPLITVSVTASDGRPMPRAPLVLMTMGAEKARTYFGKTDEAGLFRFERLMPGRFTLSITAPGERTRQKTLNVELGEGEVREIPVSFATPSAVTGKAKVNSKPYKGVLSFVSKGAAVADNLVTAGADGTFAAELEPGDYLVRTPQDTSSVSVTVKPMESQTLNVDIP